MAEIITKGRTKSSSKKKANTKKTTKSEELINKEKSLKVAAHLLGLTNWISIPGFIGPLVLMYVTDNEDVKKHAKESLNWALSSLIIFVVGILLSFVLVGIPILIALFIADLVFRIKAASKASNGEFYHYPLTIRFVK